MKKFLPVGSVILLKDTPKRVMIIGMNQREANSDKVWDYSACLFPEGFTASDELVLFNSEQIAVLFFIGLQDGESMRFLEKMNRDENGTKDSD